MILGNFLWFILGGAVSGILWSIVGAILCISIVGIPVGIQCFKIASLCFFPFKKDILFGGSVGSFLLNLIWICTAGLVLAVESVVFGLVCCVTIIGIPFGMQHFKIAKLALTPFGATIIPK